mmetsp:Transcript_85056/g.214333  ORF Transcript_85056/g.214333 Transcript_85056/m.214333 type:complete len:651 (+) Transcript_85056:88-2040(+)
MQALQVFADSLQDPNTLQRLRENLEALPKRFLSQFEAPRNHLLGSVSGEFNYHFTFRLEGGGFFQTGVLVASAERIQGGLPVPLKCRWKRRVGDIPVEIPGVTSNMYQISADDVGTDIFVEAQPADAEDGLWGRAVGAIGPFELDPATRRSLDNALGAGFARFTASQCRENGHQQDLTINVTSDSVRIANAHGSGGREIACEYTLDLPKVLIHPLDTTKFELVMSDSRTFALSAHSRTARDLIALTVRCFHARKHISSAAILRQLLPVQPMTAGVGAPNPLPPDSRLNSCIILERLIRELNRTMQQKDMSERVLRNTNNEKKELQEQLLETISGFTEVIEGLNDQVTDPSALAASPIVSIERLQEQLRESNASNATLQVDKQNAQNELERLRALNEAARRRSSVDSGAMTEEVKRLMSEKRMLEARLQDTSNISSIAQQQDRLEQVHAKEIKLLRMDVESLHNQKENLIKELRDKDSEREELQQNFFYVKGQLDKVQLKQAQSAANAGDGSRELHKHQQTIDMVGEERSRLSMRLEAILNDAEKAKSYHEQSVERVMKANGRLMEEKDRASREVQRLSQLYADSVKNLQSETDRTMTTGAYKSEVYEGGDVCKEDFDQVRAQLAAAEEALAKREQENESLKSRIRKLAVA